MQVRNILLDKYGYLKPIFNEDVSKILKVEPNNAKQIMFRLKRKRLIEKFSNGIYYFKKDIDNAKEIMDVRDVIQFKYLLKNGNTVGYYSYLDLAFDLQLIKRRVVPLEVVTNYTKHKKRTVDLNGEKLILRMSRIEINDENHKYLRVLDLLTNIEDCEVSEDEVITKICKYIEDEGMNIKEFKQYALNYPGKTNKMLIKAEMVFDNI